MRFHVESVYLFFISMKLHLEVTVKSSKCLGVCQLVLAFLIIQGFKNYGERFR